MSDSVVSPPYKAIPTKDHPSYKTRFQMNWDSKLLLNCPFYERPPSYKTTLKLQKRLSYVKGDRVMVWFRFIVLQATFNNILVISWRSVL
jgi:hypothetical protein